MSTPTQSQIDRAAEWTSEHYPEADDATYEAKLAEAIEEIVDLDAEDDELEARRA